MKNRFPQKRFHFIFQFLFYIFLFFQPLLIKAQISIPGIDSLSFTKKVSDYSQPLTEKFYLHSMEVNPGNLHLKWDATNQIFSLYGTAKIHLKEEEIFVSFGDSLLPGLIIKGDTLNAVNANITSSFDLKGITITPMGLGIVWNRVENYYGIYGTLKVKIDTDSIEKATLGDSIQPGIKIINGKIEHINIGVTSRFKLKSVEFIPDKLTFNYDTTGHAYKFYGSLKINLENDTIDASLGNASDQGISISQGVIEHINIGITTDFKLKSLEIKPIGLTFVYDKSKLRYSLYGTIKTIIESDTLVATLGDNIKPGISIAKGVIEYINIGVTSDFKLKSLEIKPVGLTFVYDKSKQSYRMFGRIKTVIESDSLVATLGDSIKPGISITKGVIEYINIGITSDFKLKSLEIKPVGLTFVYDKSKQSYSMYGTIKTIIESDTLMATLGNISEPGIRIYNGKIEYINIGVSARFKLKSVDLIPDKLTFNYDSKSAAYKIYGSLQVIVESDSLKAILGDSIHPGISIVNGNVKNIDLGITSDFKLKGLTIHTDSLGFSWMKVKDSDEFHLYGKVNIDIKEDKVGFSFGGRSNPGLIYKNDAIQYIRFSTSADLHFGGMEVGSKDFTIEHKDNVYHAYGKLFVKEVWSAAIDLGSGPGSGVTLNLANNKTEFKIDKAIFDLGNVNLGTFNVQDIKMTIVANVMNDVKATMVFKPGWKVNSELKFVLDIPHNKYSLDTIDINWQATSIANAIAIPGTGAFVMSMEGKIDNPLKPSNFIFNGNMGIVVGEDFKAGGHDASFVYIKGGVRMDKKGLYMKDEAFVGAYKNANGTWESVFGKGIITLNLKWGGTSTLKGTLNIPDKNTIISTSLDAKLSKSGAFNSLLDVKLKVPKSIPVIGGHTFGRADGAIHYKKNDNGNFIAGWITINLLFKKLHTGVKYNFKNEKFTHIGSGGISDIKKIVKVAPARMKGVSGKTSPLYWDKLKISVDEGIMPHYIQVKLKLKQPVDSIFTRITAPVMYNNQNYVPCYYVDSADSLNDETLDLKMLTTHNYLWSKNKDEIIFFILPVGYDTEIGSRLAAGDYWLETANTFSAGIIDMDSIEVSKIFEKPRIEYQNIGIAYTPRISDPDSTNSLVEDLSWNIKLKAETSNPDSTEVHLLYSRDKGDGTIVFSRLYRDMENADKEISKTTTITDDLNPNDSLIVWAIIDDKMNPVVTTEQVLLDYKLPFKGKISIINEPDTAAAAIPVSIQLLGKDMKWYPLNDTIVNQTTHYGVFGFTQQVATGTQIQLLINIPYGYEVDSSSIMKPNTTYTIGATKGFDFGTIYLKETSN